MGLLTEGSPLTWEETEKYCDHVRQHGIQQFIYQYHKLKDRCCDVLKWGDEVEYTLVRLNHEARKAQLNLKSSLVLPVLQELEQQKLKTEPKTSWHPEYAEYMIEGTPGKPYGGLIAHYNMVEANMKARREEALSLLKEPGETLLSLTAFPRLGCPNFTYPEYKPTPQGGASRSLFFPDEAIHKGHPRFKTLTRNIRHRKGSKVAINYPIFKDKNTPSPFVEDFSELGDDGEGDTARLPDHIYLDCMGFGMGCSCLQMTFQAVNIDEARHLYDQLTPLTPILMALSAASPIYRGYLSDKDCRWGVISASVDDRTREERGLEPLKKNKFVISKSRYDSIDSYLSPAGCVYNDIDLTYDKDIFETLINAGIDKLLAQHIAHLFIRDPVSLFSEKINQNDQEDLDHFENIQSTNWQTMRFKIPPPGSDIGWRVEFRPTEVQLTDFENAAFVVFIVMMTRVILTFELNLLLPISKVDVNVKNAQKREAINQEKFYFRKDLFSKLPDKVQSCLNSMKENDSESLASCDKSVCNGHLESEYDLMTVDEIINGNDSGFPGLMSLINYYIDSIECDVDTRCSILQYLSLIQNRASGELKTTAGWMRDFVTSHPSYKQDSVVSEEINYDLMRRCDEISNQQAPCPDLLPEYSTKTQNNIPSAVKKHHGQGVLQSKSSSVL